MGVWVGSEVGDWLHTAGLVTYVHMLRVMEARFLTDKKVINRKEKTRMNFVVLDWNWQYQCDHMFSHIYE